MMLQHESVPHKYRLDGQDRGPSQSLKSMANANDLSVNLCSTDHGTAVKFTFEALRPNLFRTTFTSKHHPLPPYPSTSRPEPRFDDVLPSSLSTDSRKGIGLGEVTAVVDWSDTPVVSLYLEGEQKPIHRNLNFRSYALDASGIAHYTAYKRNTLHVGLGEKAAPMNLSNRHFIISATDCFGYDVYRTDPMYKHIPLLINVTPKGCVAMFSASHSRGTWAVGSEVDGLWGHFKVYRQAHGGLEEYLIIGRTIKDVVKTYADLVGYPLLVPRWALGYIAGGMKYSMLDEPRACDAHLDFTEKLREHDIPCSAFQMSSGYTVAETEPKTRNVFTWNHHRFPDPADFTKKMHAVGIRLLANIKPYVLANHPAYEQLVQSGAMFTDPQTGRTAVARLWSAGGGESGEGSHIDFTSKAGFQWWVEGVKALKSVGIDAMWNDNNEFSIPNDGWELALETETLPVGLSEDQRHIGLWGRAMHTELMGKASHDALVESEPDVRPFVLTRSATAGTMRYCASSWSGDNVTSWEGMKGANALSLNAGMSLLQSYGHDIGGFEGPQPSPELLLRWIQFGIYSPRFAINCFKTSTDNNLVGDVIEPWMYPSIIPEVRETIKRRYELIPYLYSLALDSHMTATPPQRWIGWGYESDPFVWSPALMTGETQYWLGEALLIGGSGVYDSTVETSRVYLPKVMGMSIEDEPSTNVSSSQETLCSSSDGIDGGENHHQPCVEGYLNLNAPYDYHIAGRWVTIPSPWKNSIPVLAKIGSAIPVGKPQPTISPLESRTDFPTLVDDDYRGVEIFPPPPSALSDFGSLSSGWWNHTWYEDDGLSAVEKNRISSFTISYSCSQTEIRVGFEIGAGNDYTPAWKELSIILPVGDGRVVVLDSKKMAYDTGIDSRGRRVFSIPAL